MASGLPRICLMRREAWLRSQSPMSQRPVKPAGSELVELLVGDLVEARIARPYWRRKLGQPHVGGLRHEHQLGHPVAVLAEGLGLLVEAGEAGHRPRGRRKLPSGAAGGRRRRSQAPLDVVELTRAGAR